MTNRSLLAKGKKLEDRTAQKVIEIFRKFLDEDGNPILDITLDSSLFDDLDLDTHWISDETPGPNQDYVFLMIILDLEEIFKLGFSDEDIKKWITVRDVVEYIEKHLGGVADY